MAALRSPALVVHDECPSLHAFADGSVAADPIRMAGERDRLRAPSRRMTLGFLAHTFRFSAGPANSVFVGGGRSQERLDRAMIRSSRSIAPIRKVVSRMLSSAVQDRRSLA